MDSFTFRMEGEGITHAVSASLESDGGWGRRMSLALVKLNVLLLGSQRSEGRGAIRIEPIHSFRKKRKETSTTPAAQSELSSCISAAFLFHFRKSIF